MYRAVRFMLPIMVIWLTAWAILIRYSLAARTMIKRVFKKLNRMLTAISYAESGDLDAVKEILEQDRAKKALARKRDGKGVDTPSAVHHDMHGAKAI